MAVGGRLWLGQINMVNLHLRGKMLNVRDASMKQITDNAEIRI